MRDWCFPLTIVALFALAPTGAQGAESVPLTVEIAGVKTNEGLVLCALYKGEDGFPGKPERAFQRALSPIKETSATCRFEGLPAGRYAVAVVHDENGNGKMDRNFLGIPKEGYGASNNAKGSMGPPKFKDAAFVVGAEAKSIEITMQ